MGATCGDKPTIQPRTPGIPSKQGQGLARNVDSHPLRLTAIPEWIKADSSASRDTPKSPDGVIRGATRDDAVVLRYGWTPNQASTLAPTRMTMWSAIQVALRWRSRSTTWA